MVDDGVGFAGGDTICHILLPNQLLQICLVMCTIQTFCKLFVNFFNILISLSIINFRTRRGDTWSYFFDYYVILREFLLIFKGLLFLDFFYALV